MSDVVLLGVYRRLDNRFENEADDSPRALELHNRRRDALHSAFDGQGEIRVVTWGATDDGNPHEFVELSLAGVAGAVFTYALVPGLQWLGKKLAEKAVDTALSELAKTVVAKLRPKQEAKQLLDFQISLPDGTAISVDPPDRNATITISFKDGKMSSLNYSSDAETG
ncbi:hypothetical protein [Pseudomonas fluorescens]|uniref:hypothetical protein n=1 Tax=Pseudomonas fluorescens TaxID=294 RepID=UPI0012427BDC|nr:hypothetical protein [Pseudomonas fluorescens]VVN23271.1 hypothetical protein PS639_04403 [Pseudomonas fluorescens]